ncbi:C69 family dipeptidase [Mobiluncus curtisii]|uniref:C69 family dipeptidase n=1 Tax=Mobiluncus curtisii TaxID=2051 RepID=UPI0020927AB8|nr:C69 family dipeptidase [Mobiluncus curtisii]
MGCTTILVGKHASADGSTIMARTDDSGHGSFEAKRFEVIAPEDLPKNLPFCPVPRRNPPTGDWFALYPFP